MRQTSLFGPAVRCRRHLPVTFLTRARRVADRRRARLSSGTATTAPFSILFLPTRSSPFMHNLRSLVASLQSLEQQHMAPLCHRRPSVRAGPRTTAAAMLWRVASTVTKNLVRPDEKCGCEDRRASGLRMAAATDCTLVSPTSHRRSRLNRRGKRCSTTLPLASIDSASIVMPVTRPHSSTLGHASASSVDRMNPFLGNFTLLVFREALGGEVSVVAPTV